MAISDVEAVAQLVLQERRARDRGWWERMRMQYWPEATVSISWFQGLAQAFVDRSAELTARGNISSHRMSPVIVDVRGDRALAEGAATLEIPSTIAGVEAVLISYLRVHCRAQRRAGEWRLLSFATIYERDALTPVVPGTQLHIDPAELAGFRRSYRLLSWVLASRGLPIADDLLGDDRAEDVAAFYDRAHRWLADGPANPLPAAAD